MNKAVSVMIFRLWKKIGEDFLSGSQIVFYVSGFGDGIEEVEPPHICIFYFG